MLNSINLTTEVSMKKPIILTTLMTLLALLTACQQVMTDDNEVNDDIQITDANSVVDYQGNSVIMRGDNRGDRVVGASWAGRSAVLGAEGMAATSHPLASLVAIDILKKGGSAIDAAIAANAAIGLMEPTGNGIGGDLFAIVWDPKTNKLYGLNGSGRSPKGQTLAQFKSKIGDVSEIPNWGSAPITVPGTVDAWFELHDKFGNLSMAENLTPAINYAQNGFPVTEVVSYYMGIYQNRYEKLFAQGEIEEIDNYKSTYLQNGQYIKEGQLFKNPDLANTLSTIARDGRDAFYRGELTQTIDQYFKRIGGALRYEDFANHTSKWIEPVSVNYRGVDVWELPVSYTHLTLPTIYSV